MVRLETSTTRENELLGMLFEKNKLIEQLKNQVDSLQAKDKELSREKGDDRQ